MVVWIYLGISTVLFFLAIAYTVVVGLSKSWPTTHANVIESELIELNNVSKSVLYKPNVVYEYVVASKIHKSRLISSGFNAYKNRKQAEEILSKYILGGVVAVYYHPHFHWFSFLKPGFEKSTIYSILFCIFLSGLPFVSILGSHITGNSGWLLEPIFWLIEKVV